jgi:Choline dehydrogenase and related flavoproteins
MIIDARTLESGRTVEADLCIVGAGAAGITLVHALGGLGLSIIVLEGGGLRFDAASQSLYQGEIAGHPYELDTSRIRFFGGSTNAWSGFSHPFEQQQFAQRAWVPDSGWPLSRTDLDPDYERAMALLGIDKAAFGPSSAAASAADGTATPNALSGADDSVVTHVAQLNRRRRRFGRVFRPELRQRTDVRVFLHANVTRLNLDPNASAITSIDVACLDGPRFQARAGLVVLACGGIENARLLLLSNDRQTAGLGNGNGLVGRYFMEHPTYTPARFEPGNPDFPVGRYDVCHALLRRDIVSELCVSAARQEKEGLLHGGTFIVPVYRGERSPGVVAAKAARKLAGRGMAAYALRHSLKLAANSHNILSFACGFYTQAQWLVRDYELYVHLEQAPNPDSRVLLSDRRDRLGLNEVRLDWRLTGLDRHTLARTLEVLDEDLHRRRIGRLRPMASPAPHDREPGWIWHHMGTTRMHPDPKRGVVDVDSRMHGIGNLYVAGSSIFPTSGNHTPTLTIIAMTFRLAAHLRRQLCRPPLVVGTDAAGGTRLPANRSSVAAAE